ncbi:MAG: hypothetical protein RLZZ453_1033 [Chlamydiota bacterium]|jgi:hypothetical protein
MVCKVSTTVKFETVFPEDVFGADRWHRIVPCPRCGFLTFDPKEFELFRLGHSKAREIFSRYYAALATHVSARTFPFLVVNNLNEQGLPPEIYILSCAQKRELSFRETELVACAIRHIGTAPPPWKSDEDIIAPEHAVELSSLGSDEDTIAPKHAVELSNPNSLAENRDRMVYLLAVLNIALSNNNTQMVEMLLECEWMEFEEDIAQLLYKAAEKGDTRVVSLVLESRRQKLSESDIKEALWTAAFEGRLQVVERILPSIIKSMDCSEWESVIYAAMDGENAVLVKPLLQKYIQVYKQTTESSRSLEFQDALISRAVKQEKGAVIIQLFSAGIFPSNRRKGVLEKLLSDGQEWNSDIIPLLLSQFKMLKWDVDVTKVFHAAADAGDSQSVVEALSFSSLEEADIIRAFDRAFYRGDEEMMLTILDEGHRLEKWTLSKEKAEEIASRARGYGIKTLMSHMERYINKSNLFSIEDTSVCSK